MYEYTIIPDDPQAWDTAMQVYILNEKAQEGWEVVCPCNYGLVLRRLVSISRRTYTYTTTKSMPVSSDAVPG